MSSAIVIGGGIAGAATAFELAARGIRTTLIDAGDTGQATAASAGILQPWSSSVTGDFYRLYSHGAAHYPGLLERLAGRDIHTTSFARTGGLFVSRDESTVATALERTLARKDAGEELIGDARMLSSTQLQEMFPPLAAGLTGFVVPGGGHVDGRVFRDALLDAAVSLGAQVIRGRAELGAGLGAAGAEQAEASTAGAVTVHPPAGASATAGSAQQATRGTADRAQVLHADAIVVASGAWTNALLAPLGIEVPLHPQRGQITHLRVEGVNTSGWPSVHMGDHYLVAFGDSRVAVGATREHEAGFDPRVTAAGQLSVLAKALDVAPGLADATLIETRVGLRPYPDAELPLFGRLADRLYLATGFGAGGLTMGPYIGSLVARAVAEDAQVEAATVGS
ncbi:NAD(P)/FAD-dependent oxidoreductase [Brevibacterium moorei]|uniref:NAD(P)/FAD-dependent oxidoreductase n=1 Tax=Brevibacterium moorei TaxID=2968457 RepID=UPI00211C256C|nr:FAD-binding oxidoreductase [Brevibacterium sp. 68QC2CO]MCQ9385836.1 FAD-binding oxidoreductase [Brevibacterium sp. 68QC2CO]